MDAQKHFHCYAAMKNSQENIFIVSETMKIDKLIKKLYLPICQITSLLATLWENMREH